MSNEKMMRLQNAKARVEEMTRTKERLSGALETKKARVDELEERAREEFGCEVADIPDLVESLDKEAKEALEKAERLMGITTEEEEKEDDEDALM